MDDPKQDPAEEGVTANFSLRACPVYCIVPYWQRSYCGRCASTYGVMKSIMEKNKPAEAKSQDQKK